MSQLKTDPKNIWIEIQGHTDNVGAATNEKSVLERAEAVQRYCTSSIRFRPTRSA
jgi:outer membrane protein OmpA-like peptidoglycan-associated protein